MSTDGGRGAKSSGPAPLFGYNSSIARRGRTFHVQTEDSGVGHPHVVTHVFAEGGRIVATLRTSYAAHVDDPDCAVLVRRLLVTQHREAFIALHEGRYDDDLAPEPGPPPPVLVELAPLELRTDATTRAANDHVGETPRARPALVGLDPIGETIDDVIVRHLLE